MSQVEDLLDSIDKSLKLLRLDLKFVLSDIKEKIERGKGGTRD